MESSTSFPSLLVFGPQTDLPSQDVLSEMRQELIQNPQLSSLLNAVKNLPSFWKTLIRFDPSLSDVPGTSQLEILKEWIENGGPFPNFSDATINVYALPITVILQVLQYVRYLNQLAVKNPHQVVLERLQTGGIQGFCTGFLSAIAVATSKIDADLATSAAISVRLAVSVGAYVDKDVILDGNSQMGACVAIRWREGEASEKEIMDLIHSDLDEHAYISSTNDISCVSVTARASSIQKLTEQLQGRGLRVTPVHVQGKFHSNINLSSVEKLIKFATHSSELQLPNTDELQVPLRSTVDAEIITDRSLVQHALENTLLKCASWFSTLDAAINQLAGCHKTVAFAGFGNHIPHSLVQNSDIRVLSLHGLEGSFSKRSNKPLNGFTNGTYVNGTHESTNGHLTEEDDKLSDYPANAIAIVGMSGRFPGADSLDELWELLLSQESRVEPAPVEKLRLPTTGDHASTKWWGNFIRYSDAFDHKFFKKSSREAIAWDPQQRILLEVVYEALESAGYFGATGTEEPDDYGCYIGAVMNNYYDNVSCHPATAYATLGTSRCFLSGCMSHYFGWTGPSLTIDTACSSSLVAINTACRAIWSGECSRAIAGGTNVITSPFDYQNLKAAGFLSPNGQCKPFDGAADGYCRGEGVGVVVLKPLAAAIKENDQIFGVIVGSAANQNQNLSHITVPHSGSQVKLYQNVMNQAGVAPQSVTYVEAHGTGTGVGDPVEYQSIRDAFGGPSRDSILHFGSIKGNIGHTEATAGIAGLIKVLLMMQHGKIPGQASHKQMNPKIPTAPQDHMAISRSLIPWDPAFFLACVNSYGAAGSNAAVMVRQSPPKAIASDIQMNALARSSQPLFLSAASASSLSSYSKKLLTWLNKVKSDVQISDLAFNLADRANHSLSHVVSTTVANMHELRGKLSAIASGENIVTVQAPKPVVLVFGGQESEFVGISQQVYDSSKLFRQHLDACNTILVSLGFESLFPAIFQSTPISNLVTLHTALFAVQYASAKTWMDSGLEVNAVVGHSFGQLTALCISGTLSLPDTLKIVTGRASIMLKHWGSESGSMVFLQADEDTVSDIINEVSPDLEIACHNGPKNHVVVGSTKEINTLDGFISNNPTLRESIRTKRLKVTHGFHSRFTEPLLSHLTSLAEEVAWRKPTIHLETCDDDDSMATLDSNLLAWHTRKPVFFQRAIERLTKQFPECTFVEAGRGSSVVQLVKGSVIESQKHLIFSPQLTTANAQGSLADTTVALWKAGYAVQYWPFHRSQKPDYELLRLPPYQFEKTRMWLGFTGGRGDEKVEVAEPAPEIPTVYELLNFLKFKDQSKKEASFRIAPQSDRFKSMLGGHVMAGQSLAPASLYFEVAARAAMFLQSDTLATTFVPLVEDLLMKSPIGLDTSKDIILTLKHIDDSRPAWSFSITTQSPPTSTGHVSAPFEHSTGRVYLQRRNDSQAAQRFKRFETLTGSRRYDEIMNHPEAETMQGSHIYRAFNHIVHYAENFRGIKKVACLRMEAAGIVKIVPDPSDPVDQRLCDTPMTDSFMQFAGFLVNYFNNPSLEDVLVCMKIEHIEIGGDFNPDAKEWLVYSNMTEGGETDASSDAYIFEADSKKMVMAAFGFRFSKMSQSLLARMLKSVNHSGAAAAGKPDKPISQKIEKAPFEESQTLIQASKPSISTKPAKKSSTKRAELLEVLHNVTDIPIEDLKDESTLDDLGIDSLMATEVLNDIRSVMGLTIDLTSFLFFPDIKAMLAYIDEQFFGADAADAEESEHEESETSTSGIPTPGSTVDDLKPTHEDEEESDTEKPASRPSINSAYDAFKEIRLGYDQLAVGTKAVNFWAEAYPQQKRLVLAYVVEAFAKLGCDMKALRPGDAVPEIQALTRHKQVVRQYYRVLEDGDLITTSGAGFVRTAVAVDRESAEEIYQTILDPWPQHANVNKLVKIIGAELAECLTGEKDGLQLIFGNRTNKHLLEDMYENWPLLQTPTFLVGDFLRKAFTNFTGSGKFRILEIGAGTGGTTKYIVKHLQSHGIPFEYTFTDISSSLVSAAKKQFKDVKGMSFELLDIEKPPTPEYENAFHVIIATNCIHATRRLDVSLANLHKMLRDDGALTLVEITKNMFWLDIVVGLFEGWWLFEDGRSHALVNEKHWEREMKAAGFKEVLWTDGNTPESKTVRVVSTFKSIPEASKELSKDAKKPTIKAALETVVYKTLGNTDIHADVYYPIADIPKKKMPIALMIHGGSHIIFSRKDIRPAQTRLLLEKGFIPVSLDHRLCPEAKLAEGAMVDICDALDWARNKLPHIKLKRSGLQIDGERVVVVGWSSGGQLAMSLSWTAPQRGLKPPEAILGFYCPTHYEDDWWRHPIQPIGAEDRGDDYDLLEAIQDEPITNYGVVGAWEPLSDPRIRTDPRCRIVLHINWKAQTLPIIIGGLLSKRKAATSTVRDWKALPQPSLDEIIPVSPRAQIVRGNYRTPTFLIHGTSDDLIPWEQSQGTYNALLEHGVTTDLVLIEGAPHICDLSSDPESDGWKAVLKGYEFLCNFV